MSDKGFITAVEQQVGKEYLTQRSMPVYDT